MKEHKVLFWAAKRSANQLPMLLGMIFANAGKALCAVWFALSSRAVIDTAIEAAKTGAKHDFYLACIGQFAIIFFLLVCSAASRYLSDRLNADLDRDRKQHLFGCLLRADYANVAQFHSGELINRLNNDVRYLNNGIVNILPNLVSMIVRLGAAGWVLLSIAPKLVLIIAVIGVIVLAGTGFLRRLMRERHLAISKAEGKVLSILQETLERLIVVQSMNLGKEVEKRADRLLEERTQAQNRRRRLSVPANTAVGAVFYFAKFAAMFWCASSLMSGNMSFGTLTAVVQLISQLQAPMIGLSGVLPQYTAMCTAGERLMELERLAEKDEATPDREKDVTDFNGSIIGENVSFAYDEDMVLDGASFHIPFGKFTAITGASGIGKSTLLKLLLEVYRPATGRLFVEQDGEQFELNKIKRGLFAYVPQGNLLFSGTLRENILLARPEATEEQLEQAIYVSAMDAFLNQLPQGLDTVLGENGEGLSEGQAQRLAIARAVISGAPVLLLDEATSAMDAQTERTVLERIAQLPGCTCVAVTHRPAALETADQQLEVRDHMIYVRRCR
ncbi:MAG: ABC transporter ATP-binding protein [Oscillospiraceae bacterium]|nr:ABC transporter ATP-binding protein [Oscillospiraceae bacterium]